MCGLPLSVSLSMIISHRASPLVHCSAVHRSSLGWTPCHFSLQCFSLGILMAKRGWRTKPCLASSPPLPLHLFLPSILFLFPSPVKSFGSSPTSAECTVLQGSEGFPRIFFVVVSLLVFSSAPVPRRHGIGNGKGKYTSSIMQREK